MFTRNTESIALYGYYKTAWNCYDITDIQINCQDIFPYMECNNQDMLFLSQWCAKKPNRPIAGATSFT